MQGFDQEAAAVVLVADIKFYKRSSSTWLGNKFLIRNKIPNIYNVSFTFTLLHGSPPFSSLLW